MWCCESSLVGQGAQQESQDGTAPVHRDRVDYQASSLIGRLLVLRNDLGRHEAPYRIGSYGLGSRAFGSRTAPPTTKSHAAEIMNANAAVIATAATYSPAMWSATSNAAPTSWAV